MIFRLSHLAYFNRADDLFFIFNKNKPLINQMYINLIKRVIN